MLKCTNVLLHKCTNALVHQCTYALNHQSNKAPINICISVLIFFVCAMMFCFTLPDHKKTIGQTMIRSLVRPLNGGKTDTHTDEKPKTEKNFAISVGRVIYSIIFFRCLFHFFNIYSRNNPLNLWPLYSPIE